MFLKILYRWGDRLEDRVRRKLSHYPILYAFVGGTGIIIFWRGIWHTADFIMEYYFSFGHSISSTSSASLVWWDGPLSVLAGAVLLLLVGLWVPSFIGNEIIISGLKGEKKAVEKTEQEVKEEALIDVKMASQIQEINQRLENIEKRLGEKQF